MNLPKMNFLQKLIMIVTASALLYLSFNSDFESSLAVVIGIIAAAIFLIYAANDLTISPMKISSLNMIRFVLYAATSVSIILVICLTAKEINMQIYLNSLANISASNKDFEELAKYGHPAYEWRGLRMFLIVICSLTAFTLIGWLQVIKNRETPPLIGNLYNMYEMLIGKKSTTFYLQKFELFDKHPSSLNASWNWATFCFTGVWALYRKMYGWFFVFLGISVLSTVLAKSTYPWASLIVLLPAWIVFAVYSNALYHLHIKNRMLKISNKHSNEHEMYLAFAGKSGVNLWLIIVFVFLPIIGVFAAIIIPLIAHH
jgi:hypothetical protein